MGLLAHRQLARALPIGLLIFSLTPSMAANSAQSVSIAPPRAVIELFTSQGCSSCPPADKVLSAYARDESVIALTYSVSIWDHLGWRDTLASEQNTARFKAYAAKGDNLMFTPQAVIDGTLRAVGSDMRDIERKCASLGDAPAGVRKPLSVALGIQGSGKAYSVHIPRWTQEGGAPQAQLVLISYRKQVNVPITRGENAGRSATYDNVVTSVRVLRDWNGNAETVRIEHDMGADEGAVVLLQQSGDQGLGAVLGAARI